MADANHDQGTIDVLTRLVTCLAEHIIDIEAELVALKGMQKASLQCVAEVDSNEFDRQLSQAKAAHKPIAESQLLDQIRALGLEPSLVQLISDSLH